MSTAEDSGRAAPLVDALASAFIGLLTIDDDMRRELDGLSGRVIAVELRDTDRVLYVQPTPAGLKASRYHEAEVDVRIAVRVRDLLAVARAHKNGHPLAAGQVDIQGDLATAQRVQKILANLEVDWEEFLSRYLGDVAAHQIGRAARSLSAWMNEAGSLIEQDLSEYLQREFGLLPTRVEHDLFLDRAALLNSDVERLGARVHRLGRKLRET